MSHLDETPERPSWWRRASNWLTDSYDEALTITDHPQPPAPDLADDLPHVADAVRREPEVRRRASTTQQRMVEAVLTELDEHGRWLTEHPDTPQRERVERARRVVFRAVQAAISVVRPVAERDARRAALEEAAAYVAQQRSVVEAAEGLRRHLRDEALPMRPERYPHAEQAARTTGPLAVVPPPHLVGLPTAVLDGEHVGVVDL